MVYVALLVCETYSDTPLIMSKNKLLAFSSDFVTNSYGESWDSSCEKSGVLVPNQWVPVEKKTDS